MRVAVVCPIGHLDKHGYQYICGAAIASMCAFADRVYLVQSVRNRRNVEPLLEYPNLTYTSDESTWFELDERGAEVFDAYKPMKNVNLGMAQAREDGADVGVCVFVNWVVPQASREGLRARFQKMLDTRLTWDWLYRADQLAGQMFHASTRLPFIVNLSRPNLCRFGIDSLKEGEMVWEWQKGDYREQDGEAVVDVQLEMTRRDLEQKMNYIRCYSDLVPKRSPVFEWEYWLRYYVDKFGRKARAGELGPEASRVAQASRSDFVSHDVLGRLA